MSGKLLKSALIASVAALLLMMAAPAPAQAANEDRAGAFGYPGWWVDQQDRWRDRRDGGRVWRVERRGDRRYHRGDRSGDRRDDRRDRWGDRRDDRREAWNDRRDRRHGWRRDRWRGHWDRWDRRAARRRHRHPHGHRWHRHRY